MKSFEDVLIDDKRKLDENQREAVYCDDNCVVKAGAGSGKTTVLSYRFLRLVLEGKADCNQILTLTFTKKAATEMSERIYQRLLSAGLDRQLELFSEASICTLDSFFASIVKSDCLRYGLTKEIKNVEEDDVKNVLRIISHVVFKETSNQEGTISLAKRFSPELLENLIEELGTKYFTIDQQFDAKTWAKMVLVQINKTLASCINNFDDSLQSLKREIKSEYNLLQIQKALEAREGLEDQRLDYSTVLEKLKTVKINGQKDRGTKEVREEFAKRLEELCVCLASLINQDSFEKEYKILEMIQNKFNYYKKSTGQLSFNDVSRLALKILKTNHALRNFYKKKFKYIMIDEFQDNNELQKEILYYLAEKQDRTNEKVLPTDLEKSKLFFVGDEKQSIYSFRGADVSVFKALSDELVSIGGKSISLNTNYRTEPALIEEFNLLFNTIMGPESEYHEPYEAVFEKLGTRGKKIENSKFEFYCLPYTDPKNKESEDLAEKLPAEAYHVAQLIKKMVESDEYLIPTKDGGTRRPKYSDIAILLGKLSNQHHYEKALRIEGIPYVLQQTRALLSDAISYDIYNALQLCIYSDDKIAYYALLSSPLCKLQLSQMNKKKTQEGLGLLDLPIFCDEAVSLLEGEDQEKFIFAKGKFETLLSMVGNSTIVELIDFIINDWGYNYLVATKKTNHPFSEHFESMWLFALQFDDLLSFLEYVRPKLGKNEKIKDFEILREDVTGVQIMTVHKSKGLEFPIVILANCGAKKPTNNNSVVEEIEGTGIPVPNHMNLTIDPKKYKNFFNYFYKDTRSKKALAEVKRVLYVALTRAEYHFVAIGAALKNKANEVFLYILADALGLDFKDPNSTISPTHMVDFALLEDVDVEQTYITHAKLTSEDLNQAQLVYQKAKELKINTQSKKMGVTSYVSEFDNAFVADSNNLLPSIPSDSFIQDQALFTSFGTFAHEIMELSLKNKELKTQDLLEKLDNTEGLKDLTDSQKKTVLQDCMDFVANFKSTSFFEDIKNQKIDCEVKFFYGVDEPSGEQRLVLEGIIDLLIEKEDEFIIIDYKTDKFKEPSLHQKQLALYSQALGRLTSKPIHTGLCYLREPKQIEWLS